MNCCWNVLERKNWGQMHLQNHLLHLLPHFPGFPLNHTQVGLQTVAGKAVGVIGMWISQA